MSGESEKKEEGSPEIRFSVPLPFPKNDFVSLEFTNTPFASHLLRDQK